MRINLDTLSRIANLSKYSLLRMFTRHKGITPYRYLETVRIGEAKSCWHKELSRWKRHCKQAFPT